MSYRTDIVKIALDEASKPVHWKAFESRILEYFKTSTGHDWKKVNALKISWCTYFAHWVLAQAKVSPLPAAGNSNELNAVHGSTGRFMKRFGGVYQDYAAATRKYTPRPGDLYYRPAHNDHIGVIVAVSADGKSITTVDGNSGPMGFSPYFDMSYGRQIGYGFIMKSAGTKILNEANDIYIALPDGSR
ncbi:MAG TPA: CHAP domain-containing protein [Bryobacteraceae bacterium]|jgi:hypothetical protein|nr:CHAP domain-containing protein [Bryobacteraceae bacterium]